ncbi:MAG TPA: YCF48-related protein, partial [Fimbriiglobus sp.]
MPRFLLATLFVAAIGSTAIAQFPPSYDDAPLRAVQFVDKQEGWAVGDQGVVWHTTDGGNRWERQKSGTRASLRAIHFLTPFTGWAAGRVEQPYGMVPTGVVLKTTDGGLHWQEVAAGILPGLNVIKFFDGKNGIVAGDGCPAFPAGVFKTTDGGENWAAVPGQATSGWLGGNISNLNGLTGILVGKNGSSGSIRDGNVSVSNISHNLGSRSIRQQTGMRQIASGDDPIPFIMVGDGGLLTGSSGECDLPIPTEARGSFDFQAFSNFGQKVWVNSRPGSVIFHSADAGKTWRAQKTGLSTPLHAIQMIDESTGFAVGDLGTILATTDGGKTWQVRKCGGQRAAVLFIHATPDAVPLDTVALLGAKEGYYCQALSVTGSDKADLLNAAVRACGGSGAEALWMFPNPKHLEGLSAKEILAYWDKLHAGKAREQLLRQLVLTIRIWQPEVIVTDRVDANATGLEQLVMLATREAFKLAGDPKAFPEQIEHLGLKVHTPKTLYGKCESAKDAMVTYDNLPFCAPLDNDLRDFCETGSNLLGPASIVPEKRYYRLVSHATAGAEKHTSLTDGLALNRGGTARRDGEMGVLREDLLAYRKKMAAGRRAFEALTAAPEKFTEPDKFLAAVRKSLAEMQLPEDVASRTAFAAAARFAREGRWGLAREMFAFVSDTFSAHPEAAVASRWLIQYHSSAAVIRRIELGQVNPIPAGVFESTDSSVKPAGATDITGPKQLYRFTSGGTQRIWTRCCLDLESKLVAFGPIHARDPLVRACLTVARDRGAVTLPDAVKPVDNRPVWACARGTKPTLDGKLIDECWEKAVKVPLTGPAGFDTEARFAFDDQFLYVAIMAKHPADKQVAKVEKRERDADLRGHDRVEWQFDPDGSGATTFRFAVDHRGCLAEDCWGATDWNPKWFVAFDSTATDWTAEVAIPLVEMTGGKMAGRNWGVDVTRIVP